MTRSVSPSIGPLARGPRSMHVLPWPLVPVLRRAAHVPLGPALRRPRIASISRPGLHWAAAFAPRACGSPGLGPLTQNGGRCAPKRAGPAPGRLDWTPLAGDCGARADLRPHALLASAACVRARMMDEKKSKVPGAFGPFDTRRALHPPFRIPRQQLLSTRLIPPPSSAAVRMTSGRRAGRLWRGRWGG